MKNTKISEEFLDFHRDHPQLRFWQAIQAFTEAKKIEVNGKDPFYWTKKLQ